MLNHEVAEWFHAAGLLLLEGYGLTETCVFTCLNNPRTPRFGTVGPPLPGSTIKIAADGEIMVKGPSVMRGYHNEPDGARSSVDGWFATGDIGELDDHGYLRITDRKKDLIKTSGGKYIAPQKVEGVLKAACPYISQVLVHGEAATTRQRGSPLTRRQSRAGRPARARPAPRPPIWLPPAGCAS